MFSEFEWGPMVSLKPSSESTTHSTGKHFYNMILTENVWDTTFIFKIALPMLKPNIQPCWRGLLSLNISLFACKEQDEKQRPFSIFCPVGFSGSNHHQPEMHCQTVPARMFKLNLLVEYWNNLLMIFEISLHSSGLVWSGQIEYRLVVGLCLLQTFSSPQNSLYLLFFLLSLLTNNRWCLAECWCCLFPYSESMQWPGPVSSKEDTKKPIKSSTSKLTHALYSNSSVLVIW